MTFSSPKDLPLKQKNSSSLPKNNQKIEAKKLFPIVGVGASAGGLPAFSELLSHLPENPGLAIVFIQHMDANHVSQLPSLLSRLSLMPVLEVKAAVCVEENHVYLISPNSDLQISDGILQLSSPHQEEKPPFRLPIDTFLESLAKDQKELAVGVILSGTGRDGAAGLAAIKSQGGMVFVQDENSAQYPDMPKAAMSVTQVDGALTCKDIAKKLLQLASSPLRGPPNPLVESTFYKYEDQQLVLIFKLLREKTGTDFSHYKPTTIQRRILRRMITRKATSLNDYIELLQNDKEEAAALHKEMLIHLTDFFRDPEVFNLLKEKIIPEILKDRNTQTPLRIWVPACSTGKEVYSLAILILESLEKLSFPIQIFGSDISDAVLEKARTGIYSEEEMGGVSEGRKERFFIKGNGNYQIAKNIRDLCIFANHDVTSHPPFSKLDLISCRNLLIYLDLNLQNKLFSIFHYALKPNGFLMLGTAENIGNLTNLFGIANKKGNIYSRKSIPHKLPIDILGISQWGRHVVKTSAPNDDKFDLAKESSRVLLEKFVPPGVVVNEDMTILRFQGHMRPYLDPTAGGASLNLMKMVTAELVSDLRLLMSEAFKENKEVIREGVPLLQNGHVIHLHLQAIPLPHPGTKENYFIILFQKEKIKFQKSKILHEDKLNEEVSALKYNRQLQKDLETSQKQLQTIIKSEEAANQELREANEEFQSTNEEFQSTNEELETAKEELQSTNEELSTVNDELRLRNMQLDESNADLKNLFVSANLPIIMLHSDLRIRHFTPMSEKIVNLKSGDEGRFISDFKLNVDISDLEDLIHECTSSGQSQERNVKDKKGTWHLLQIRPYRTAENEIAGVVIALINIHPLKTALEQLTDAHNYSESIIQTILNPILVLDADLRVVMANECFYKNFQALKEETVQQCIYDLGDGQWNIPRLKTLLEVELPKKVSFGNYEVDHEFPRVGRKIFLLNASNIFLKKQGKLTILSMQDITQQKEDSLNLQLQYEVIKALSEPIDLTHAVHHILKSICRRFSWQAGQLWVVEDEDLVPAFFWSNSLNSCPALEKTTHQKRYTLEKKKDSYVPELSKEFHSERNRLASECGFQIPFIFLIQHKNKILGALEFFSDKPLKIEKDLIPLAKSLGNLIGQFIENKEAEKSRHASDEIFRSSKLRQQFAAMTSHELRTPLTAIKEGINLVLEEFAGPLNDEQKEDLRISQNNVDRLSSLINNLLDITRMDSDCFQVFFSLAELRAVIKEVCDSMKQIISMK